MNTVSERLKYALIVRDVSQSELARRIGVTRGAISNLLNNVSQGLSAENALKIAEALELDPYWLIFGRGDGPLPKDALNYGVPPQLTAKDEAKQIINSLPMDIVVKVLKKFTNV